ncbi:hypothetical protein G6F63_016818 [Rhizopus arrhizus]|nr:hypothetical protein G6F63_016818 [Rhizopus arrhizus]
MFKMEDEPFIPTVPNNLDQLQQQVNSILTKHARVPRQPGQADGHDAGARGAGLAAAGQPVPGGRGRIAGAGCRVAPERGRRVA